VSKVIKMLFFKARWVTQAKPLGKTWYGGSLYTIFKSNKFQLPDRARRKWRRSK